MADETSQRALGSRHRRSARGVRERTARTEAAGQPHCQLRSRRIGLRDDGDAPLFAVIRFGVQFRRAERVACADGDRRPRIARLRLDSFRPRQVEHEGAHHAARRRSQTQHRTSPGDLRRVSKPASGCILLVDHSRGSLLFQESILRRRQAAIATALTGTSGLEIARSDRPQLIMFAFDLFDMTAPEFCREIRADASTRGMSLLLVGERDTPEQADLCLSAGCNDVIYRPLQRQELDQKVARLTSIPSRRELRTLTRIEVSVEKNGRFIIGRSINISASGMFIEVDRVLPGEGRLRLHFYLPGDPKPLQLESDVLRAEFTGGTAKYGVRFIAADDAERERIERFVRRLRSRELL